MPCARGLASVCAAGADGPWRIVPKVDFRPAMLTLTTAVGIGHGSAPEQSGRRWCGDQLGACVRRGVQLRWLSLDNCSAELGRRHTLAPLVQGPPPNLHTIKNTSTRTHSRAQTTHPLTQTRARAHTHRRYGWVFGLNRLVGLRSRLVRFGRAWTQRVSAHEQFDACTALLRCYWTDPLGHLEGMRALPQWSRLALAGQRTRIIIP